jgi:hypothetical protein
MGAMLKLGDSADWAMLKLGGAAGWAVLQMGAVQMGRC